MSLRAFRVKPRRTNLARRRSAAGHSVAEPYRGSDRSPYERFYGDVGRFLWLPEIERSQFHSVTLIPKGFRNVVCHRRRPEHAASA